MKFYVDHPTDAQTQAQYGWDCGSLIQCFVVIRRNDRVIATCDGLTGEGDLHSALKILVQYGFFESWHIEAAHQQLRHTEVEDLDPELRLAGEVLVNFKIAAA